MEPISDESVASGETRSFRFVHGATYEALQALYEECAATMDPNNIVMVLQQVLSSLLCRSESPLPRFRSIAPRSAILRCVQHPYHVDSLLSLSHVYRAHGHAEEAEDMLQRAIWTMEMAAHPRYTLSTRATHACSAFLAL